MLWKCCTQYASKFGKLSSGHRTRKDQFFPNTKECSNYCTIAIISQASKVKLKILQARLQQYLNQELADVRAGFRKVRGTRGQISNIHWITEKARKFQKNVYLCFIDHDRAFDCVDQNKLWKILKEVGIPDHLTCVYVSCSVLSDSPSCSIYGIFQARTPEWVAISISKRNYRKKERKWIRSVVSDSLQPRGL